MITGIIEVAFEAFVHEIDVEFYIPLPNNQHKTAAAFNRSIMPTNRASAQRSAERPRQSIESNKQVTYKSETPAGILPILDSPRYIRLPEIRKNKDISSFLDKR